MAHITGPADMLGPKLADGSDNPFFHDVIITLAAGKPIEFSADAKSVTIRDIVDYERLTLEKCIGLFQLTGGAARVHGWDCQIGLTKDQLDEPCPFVEGKLWSDLVGEKTNYTLAEIDGKYWLSSGAINPAGLDSEQLLTLAAIGAEPKTNSQYQKIMPQVDLERDTKPEKEAKNP